MKKITSLILLWSICAFPHGDHAVPGAIPPAPNGGVLKEAKHHHKGSHKHNHKKADEREVFFEALVTGNQISIFPLEINPDGHKSFKELKISDFTKVKIETINPRKKKTVKKVFSTEEKKWVIDLEKIKGRRFIIKIAGLYKQANYTAEVQVERK